MVILLMMQRCLLGQAVDASRSVKIPAEKIRSKVLKESCLCKSNITRERFKPKEKFNTADFLMWHLSLELQSWKTTVTSAREFKR